MGGVIKIFSVLALLLLVTGAVLLNLPLRYMAADQLAALEYTDLQGASLLRGDLWLQLDPLPGLTHLVYNWCPGISPLSWCLDIEHVAFVATGRLGVSLDQQIHLSAVDLQSLDLAELGLASGLVAARIEGRVESLRFFPSDCAIKNIEHVEARLQSASIQVFGFAAGAHQLAVNTENASIRAQLSGDTFSGSVEVSAGRYEARGEMNSPESMVSMAQTFMSPLGGNRFAWQLKGDLPC